MPSRRFVMLALLITAALHAQTPDETALRAIRQEGLERSQVGGLFDHLTTVIGPRLTGSPEYKAAAEWAKSKLEGWGTAERIREEDLRQNAIVLALPRVQPAAAAPR